MDAETRQTLIAAFKQGRATPDYKGGTNDRNGDYDYIEGPNGSKLWFIGYGDDEGDGKPMFRFHHVQLANGDNYDSPPAGSGETTTENDESSRGRSYDAGAIARKKAARQAAKKAEKAVAQQAAYAEDMQIIQQALDIDEPRMPDNIPTKPKKISRLAEKAQSYIDDYNSDLDAIRAAVKIQKKVKDDPLVKGKISKATINASKADKKGDQARAIIAEYEKSQEKFKAEKGGDDTKGDDQGTTSDSSVDTTDRSSETGSRNTGKQGSSNDEDSGDTQRNELKHGKGDADKEKSKNKQKGTAGTSRKFDTNGNNLLARFKKVYGDEAVNKYNEAVAAYVAADGEIQQTYNAGQYGHNVRIKVNGEWTSDVDVITGKLAQHASASGALSITNPDTPENALKLTRANLTTTTGGGTESGLTRRFTLAYGNGNVGTGNQILKDTVAAYKVANPGKIRIMGPNGEETQLGQPGAYVQVMYKGEWNSNSDIVSQTLAGSVSIDGAAAVPFDKLRPDQQAFLDGANGNIVMKRLNLALGSANSTDPTLVQKAIDQYAAQNPGEIEVQGTVGQPGFLIKIKTEDGWVSGTNAVVRRLHKVSTSSGVADGVKKDDRGPLGATASPKDHKRSDQDTKTGSAEISISKAAQTSKAMLGADVDSSRSLSKKELNPYKPADRNGSGTISKKEAKQYVAAANTDGVAGVSKVEAQTFKLKDVNNDGKTGKLEKKAYKELAGKDGEVSKKEAREVRQALKGQISTKQEKTTLAMANDYLKKADNKKAGGTQQDDTTNGALAGGAGQIAKPKKKDDDGPRGKNKKK